MINDIAKTFLERPEIQVLLSDLEKKRRKILNRAKIFLIIWLAFVSAFYLISPEKTVMFIEVLFYIPIIIIFVTAFSLNKIDPRKFVMSKFASIADPNIIYEYTTNIYPKWINDRRLMGDYSRLGKVRNVLKYKTTKNKAGTSYEARLEGMEVSASVGTGKHKHTTCHAFITEIIFPEKSLNAVSDLYIKAERGSLIPGFEDSKSFGLTHNKVWLESNDFEKTFDVYCEDQVEARRLLNPHTMQVMMDFVNSFNGNRSYDFIFSKDSIYVKFNLLRSRDQSIFVMFNPFKDFTKNTKLFSDFYAEFSRFKKLVDEFDPFYDI